MHFGCIFERGKINANDWEVGFGAIINTVAAATERATEPARSVQTWH